MTVKRQAKGSTKIALAEEMQIKDVLFDSIFFFFLYIYQSTVNARYARVIYFTRTCI